VQSDLRKETERSLVIADRANEIVYPRYEAHLRNDGGGGARLWGLSLCSGTPLHPNRAPVCGVDQLVTTRPATALWQVPARRSAWRRVGALTLDMRVKERPRPAEGRSFVGGSL
jgi:hypothetical protein